MGKYMRAAACAIGAGATLAFLSAQRRTRWRQIAGNVVLITGGSRGFGLALAQEFAALGCRIALCARDQCELARAKQKMAGGRREVFTVPCDVSDRDAVTGSVKAVIEHYG